MNYGTDIVGLSDGLSKRSGDSSRAAGLLLLTWLFATMALWMFAFYEVPADADDWVRRAQIACFGSDESGLPGPAGWMLLILSPLLMLGAMFLSFGKEMLSSVRQMLVTPLRRFMLLGIGLLVLCEGVWVSNSIAARIQKSSVIIASEITNELPQTYFRGTKLAPDFQLVDQFGGKQSLSAFRGKPVLLSFVFAHCQSVCPTLVKTLKKVSEDSVSKNGASLGLTTFLVTLDPWRDSPASLPGLAKEWNMGADTFILSGTPQEVNAVLDAYEVPRSRDEKNGDVVHPALVYVIDTEGKLAYSFNNPSTRWLRDALARVVK